MKISPVAGTPNIQNTSSTGLAPEKIARLKAIAAGQEPAPIEEQEQETLASKYIDTRQRIPIKTNFTTNREDVVQETQETEVAPTEPESPTSDDSVQANGTVEATQPLSPQFAALARQRRALQVKERELSEKSQALERATSLEARIKSQPLSVLQELGVTYDQLTQEILAQQNGVNPEIQALKAELKQVKEGVDKTLSEKDQAQEKAVIAEMRRNIVSLAAQGDDFEMIRETQSHDDVVDLIHRTWKETGEVMDEVEAMKLIEEDLINQTLKVAKLKKVQGKLTPEPAAVQAAPKGITTITNKDRAVPSMDRRQRAILAMRGELKR